MGHFTFRFSSVRESQLRTKRAQTGALLGFSSLNSPPRLARPLSSFFGVLLLLLLQPLSGQINVNLVNPSNPSGTLVDPHFVIDSDATIASVDYDRDRIKASIQGSFSWGGALFSSDSDSGYFRARAQLRDADGNIVELVGSSDFAFSSVVFIEVGGALNSAPSSTSEIFDDLELVPDVDLGVGETYTIEYTIQRGSIFGFLGGQPLYSWTNTYGPTSSDEFVVVHFRDNPKDPNAIYARGNLRDTPTITKTFALQTATSSTQRQFTLQVPYSLFRYDLGGSSQSIPVRFIVSMEDDLGNTIPLENDGISTSSFTRAASVTGTPITPAKGSFTRTLRVRPLAQLDARHRTYTVTVRFEHEEFPATETFLDNGTTEPSSAETLLDFNGNLTFGSGGTAIETQFSSLTNASAPSGLGPNYVETTINANGGTIPGFPDLSWGDSSFIDVFLFTNGDATVTFGSKPVTAASGADLTVDAGGIDVIYPGAALTPSGLGAPEAIIQLPQGLSFTPNRAFSGNRYQSTLVIGAPPNLSSSLGLSSSLSLATPGDAWIFDESRTLQYQVSGVTLSPAGELDFATSQAEWIHRNAFDQLESQQDNGDHQSPRMATRLTNEGYLRTATTAAALSTTTFVAATDGTVRCQFADIALSSDSFQTHFPKATEVEWTGFGQLKIRNGLIDTDSYLTQVAPLEVVWDGSCDDDDCAPPGGAEDSLEITPISGQLFITADGGLQQAGAMPPKALTWGIRQDGVTYTHRTDPFDNAHFLASGNQLYHALNPVATNGPRQAMASLLAPCVVTLAGYDPANPDLPIYDETTAYRDGVGVWPGATVVVTNSSFDGGSKLADMVADYPYKLQPTVSKYYVRQSGVSGRHVAVEGSFPETVNLYNYEFGVSRFQLTFLSNTNELSWFNGNVTVPFPCDFSQDFQEMGLSCTGALGEALIDPDDMGSKQLAYWRGDFSPLSMSFKPVGGGGCYGPRFLTMGVISGAAHIPTPLAGTLAFMPDGNLGSISDNIEGVDGRLGLPAKVELAGPGNEFYEINPVSKLYFNNYADPDSPDVGFVNFAGTCKVPFFEALKIHGMTSAQTGVPVPLFFASNWTEGGQTQFTNTKFDPTHRGFPSGIDVDEYRNPEDGAPDTYLVRAEQSIFGLIPLSYPLRWSPSARYFESWAPENNNLMVIEVDHQIDYLSADNAEISFGVKYEGMPKISLASTATEIVDGQLGAARALTEAAQSFVTDTLNQGVDEIGNLVNDNIESLLDRAIDEIDEQVLDPLYLAIVDAYDQAVGLNQDYNQFLDQSGGLLKDTFDAYLDGTAGTAATSVKEQLNELKSASNEAASVIQRVIDAVDNGILAIDSVVGEIQVFQDTAGNTVVALQAPPGFPSTPEDVVNGILAKVPQLDGTLEREIVQTLISELIKELAPPDIAAVINPLLDDLNSELNSRLNELLEKFDPTLDRITEILLEARGFLVDVKSRLQSGQDIFNSFNQIIDEATAEIDNIINQMRSIGYSFINQLISHAALPFDEPLDEIGSFLDEFDKDEFVALLKAELRDRLLATQFISSIQYQLRQTISEFDMALRSAIDSVFAEVNKICRELIKEALGPIDDAINGLVGEINDVVGAGSVDGYAHIQGDTLRRLRLDAEVELKVPDEMKLQAYFEMLCYDSETETGSAGCLTPGQQVVEVKIGAIDVPLDWVSPDLRADLNVWFSMQTQPTLRPRGIGGGLTMTGGELNFQSFKVTAFAAAVAVGVDECYLAASASVIVSDYQASGGIFFGKTCSLEPLEMVDPDVSELLGSPPFTGAYVYGEVWLPISETLLGIPATCMFRISAGVGAGAFYFVEGPTYGGRMLLGVSGEALCAISVTGEVSMTGVMTGGNLNFSGRGRISGKAGKCRLCLKFNKSAKVKYQNNKWSVDL